MANHFVDLLDSVPCSCFLAEVRLATKKKMLEARVMEVWVRAKKMGVEPGYLWLYENGFKHRVPEGVQIKIENVKEE